MSARSETGTIILPAMMMHFEVSFCWCPLMTEFAEFFEKPSFLPGMETFAVLVFASQETEPLHVSTKNLRGTMTQLLVLYGATCMYCLEETPFWFSTWAILWPILKVITGCLTKYTRTVSVALKLDFRTA